MRVVAAVAIVAAWFVAAPAGAAVTSGPGAPHGAIRVSMKEFAFKPATVTIHAGDTITWTYDESASDLSPNCESPLLQPPSPVTCPGHSTTAVAKDASGHPLWDSGVHRATGFPYNVRFLTPGTYPYYCIVHGGPHPNNPVTHMDGTIVVLAAAATSAPTPAGPPATTAPPAARVLPVTGRIPRPLPWAAAVMIVAGLSLRAAGFSRRPSR